MSVQNGTEFLDWKAYLSCKFLASVECLSLLKFFPIEQTFPWQRFDRLIFEKMKVSFVKRRKTCRGEFRIYNACLHVTHIPCIVAPNFPCRLQTARVTVNLFKSGGMYAAPLLTMQSIHLCMPCTRFLAKTTSTYIAKRVAFGNGTPTQKRKV